MRPPTPSTSTLEMLLSDAFDEFDDSNEESATFSLHAIPPSSSSSASTLEARYSLNDSGHIDPLVFDAIDRAIAVVSPNDYSIGISAETNNLYHMAPCAPHLAPRAPTPGAVRPTPGAVRPTPGAVRPAHTPTRASSPQHHNTFSTRASKVVLVPAALGALGGTTQPRSPPARRTV